MFQIKEKRKNKTIGNSIFELWIAFAINVILFMGMIITGNIGFLSFFFLAFVVVSWFVIVITSVIFIFMCKKKRQGDNRSVLKRMLWMDCFHFVCMLVIFPLVFVVLDPLIRFGFEYPLLVLGVVQIPTLIVDLLYAGIMLIVLFFQKD